MAEESDAGDEPGDGQPHPDDAERGDSPADDAPEAQPIDDTADDTQDSDDAEEHVCEVCGRSFDSAQALGGHKTAHRDNDTQDTGADADEADGAGDGSGDGVTADDAAGPDEEAPIGAVTDAEDPPAASAPGVADDAGSEASDGAVDGNDPKAEGGSEADAEGGTSRFDASESRDAGEWATDVAASSDAIDEPDASVGEDADPVSTEEGTYGPEPADPLEDQDEPLADAAMPEGPPDDQEMPLADHIEEMVLRLSVVCGVATVVAGSVFFFEPLAEDMIMFIWDSVIPAPDVTNVPSSVAGTAWPGHYVAENVAPSNPRVYGPLELKLTELKFASLVGFIVALPVFVYETYRFMRPGLYPHERRYYLAAIPTSLVLAFVGVSFAYFIILPAIFAYFVRYSERAGLLAFALRQTFDLILVLMGYMALVFQIPLFIMLAIMMGLTDRQWLEDRRLYFWGGFLGVSFLFVPEPTGMAPILVALTMIGLFEATLALLRWTGN